jgi:tetratricopeptide (TPR) repeat protein
MSDLEVERILEEHLARKLDGAAESADELCAAHPEHADVLRRRLSLLGELESKSPRAMSSELELPRAFDGYEVVRELGRGGMGVVFEAHQVRPERRVAIKLLTGGQGLTARLRERFEREISMLARIRHPNVVKVFGSGVVQGAPYVVMELVEGDSLARRPSDGGAARPAVPWLTAVKLGAKVARALDYVHELGVVHRDVKPSNVLIDARGEPVLIDFGLAREADADALTRSGEFVGTLAYTAPEQARGERVDRRADVYGLGATLFHLVTGSPPYRATSIADLVRQIDAGPPSSARRVNREVPRDLATVLEHALALQPLERYASCADLAQDLEALLEGRPIQVRRRGPGARALAWARRRPTAAALVVSLVLLFAACGAMLLRWRTDELAAREEQRLADRLRLAYLVLEPQHDDLAARSELDELVRRYPDDRTFAWLGDLAQVRGQSDAGRLSAGVWSAEGVRRLRRLYEGNREWLATEPAGKAVDAALQILEPGDGGALRLEPIDLGLQYVEPEQALRCAFTLHQLGALARAGAAAGSALDAAPDDPAAAMLAAKVLRSEDTYRAIAIGGWLHREFPVAEVSIGLAISELAASRFNGAYSPTKLVRTFELADSAALQAPHSASVLQQAGYIYHEARPAGWESKAEDYYRRAIALGDMPQARFNLHNLRWQLGLREPDTVIELLTPIEASYAHWGVYWQNLAWAHEKQGDIVRAVEVLERGVERCAPEWRSEQLDWLIYMRGRLPGGGDETTQRRDFERLLDCTPQDTAGLERLLEAAKVAGGASRDCVTEVIVERERAGVKLGENAAAVAEHVRRTR